MALSPFIEISVGAIIPARVSGQPQINLCKGYNFRIGRILIKLFTNYIFSYNQAIGKFLQSTLKYILYFLGFH